MKINIRNIVSNNSFLRVNLLRVYLPYLSIINDYILDNLNIHISKECVDMTNFLKACQKKGLTKSDIDKLYYYYYVKFKITGKI